MIIDNEIKDIRPLLLEKFIVSIEDFVNDNKVTKDEMLSILKTFTVLVSETEDA